MPVAKTLGLSLGQVILKSYSPFIGGRRRALNSTTTWLTEYALQAETQDDAQAIAQDLLTGD